MGKLSFPSWCSSCSCFSSSSPPKEETIAGTSSSSQPTQQPAYVGPLTATTTTNVESFLRKFNDISQLRDLISLIEKPSTIASGEKNEGGCSSKVMSYIQDGQTILELVDEHLAQLPGKKDSIDVLISETEKVLINLLKGVGKIRWVGAALSVVGFVLAQFNQMCNKKSECPEILKSAFNLGKQIVELNEQEQEQKLKEAVECIIVACSMCTSQLATDKSFRFLPASVNDIILESFQVKIDRLYVNLQLLAIMKVRERLTKIASEPSAVGIDSAREEVIELLDLIAQHTSPRAVIVKEAFLDIACFLYIYASKYVAYMVGEEEFRALEEASFVKTDERGNLIVHDIVRARGKKMSEGNRITDPESLSECLKDEVKLKNLKGIYFSNLKGIYFSREEPSEQPPIEINEKHLNCMSNSLRILHYDEASQITFSGKCHQPFQQLRSLVLPSDISDLPMEFEKLENLLSYTGPLTQGMSLYELPPRLLDMSITNIISSENGVEKSKIPSKDTSLVKLRFFNIPTMERLPDGLEKLTKLEELMVYNCPLLRELPSKIGDLSNLEELTLSKCPGLEEWPSSFGALSKLKTLFLADYSPKLKESLPHNIKENCEIEFC